MKNEINSNRKKQIESLLLPELADKVDSKKIDELVDIEHEMQRCKSYLMATDIDDIKTPTISYYQTLCRREQRLRDELCLTPISKRKLQLVQKNIGMEENNPFWENIQTEFSFNQ